MHTYHTCIYIYIYIHVCTCVYIYIWDVCVYIYMYMYKYTYIYIYVYIYIYICMYIYICIYTCTYMHIYIIHMFKLSSLNWKACQRVLPGHSLFLVQLVRIAGKQTGLDQLRTFIPQEMSLVGPLAHPVSARFVSVLNKINLGGDFVRLLNRSNIHLVQIDFWTSIWDGRCLYHPFPVNFECYWVLDCVICHITRLWWTIR